MEANAHGLYKELSQNFIRITKLNHEENPPWYLFDAADDLVRFTEQPSTSLDLNKLDYHIWKELTQFVYKYQRESLKVLAITTTKN